LSNRGGKNKQFHYNLQRGKGGGEGATDLEKGGNLFPPGKKGGIFFLSVGIRNQVKDIRGSVLRGVFMGGEASVKFGLLGGKKRKKGRLIASVQFQKRKTQGD